MAAGPMEIYRVPGSVSFLHSGALLHAILPRSQCWCVDGVSKFALRVLPDTYYRIELPGATSEDLEKVEELKVTLTKVLFYERTPCPFARGFSVDVKEEELLREPKGRRTSQGRAKRWTLEKAYSWKPEDWEERQRDRAERQRQREEEVRTEQREGAQGTTSSDSEEQEETEEGTQDDILREDHDRSSELADKVPDLLPPVTPSRPSHLASIRSMTSPAQLRTASRASPGRTRTSTALDGSAEATEEPTTTPLRLETSRTRLLQPIPTDMPPSPPDSSTGTDMIESLSRDEQSEAESVCQAQVAAVAIQVGSDTQEPLDQAPVDSATPAESHIPIAKEPLEAASDTLPLATHPQDAVGSHQRPSTPTRPTTPAFAAPQSHPSPERTSNPEDPFAAVHARILARRSIGGTTPSPRPQTTQASKPKPSTTTTTTKTRPRPAPLPTALLHRAANLFLGPPASLAAIMLRIAARLSTRAFGSTASTAMGFVIESPKGVAKRVPGSFNLEGFETVEDLDLDGGLEGEAGWEEDDFGVPLWSPVRLAGFDGRGEDGRGKGRVEQERDGREEG